MAATNTGQLILDMSGVGGVISATIKQSLTAIQNSLNKIAKKPAAASFDIAGLRHQIIGMQEQDSTSSIPALIHF